ncbi:MAG: PhoD-like phosphatase N-terminal domain-containing protein, partial [Desulfurellaceae bacterium]|nr:PhoD-like phosphatase N-terminal domain-containing protein [Desulfurellaceae bacterium]
MHRGIRALSGLCLLLISLFLTPALLHSEEAPALLFLTHGVASGDVTPHSAVIWTRVNAPATVGVEYALDPNFTQPQAGPRVVTDQTRDYTA